MTTRCSIAPFAVLILLAGLNVGCQGDFEPPRLDNPSDPALGQLPATPTITRVDSLSCAAGRARMRIVWELDDDTGVAEYQVFRTRFADEDPGALILHVPAGTTTTIDDTGLDQSTRYHYRVRAVDTEGLLGLRSEPRNFVTTRCP